MHVGRGSVDFRLRRSYKKPPLITLNLPPVKELRDCAESERLTVYSTAFDRIISEFKQYGPLLARIKKAYDQTVDQCQSEDSEIRFLKAKVQKLLAQNENRSLLRHERMRTLQLEEQVAVLAEENQK